MTTSSTTVDETIVLSGGRLPDGRTVDIRVERGSVAAVTPTTVGIAAGVDRSGSVAGHGATRGEGEARGEVTVHDLDGRLVLPAMAEPHAHLDKALTADVVLNPVGDLNGAIDAWAAAARTGRFHHDDTVERATRALELLLAHGVTAVRTHVNAVPGVGAANVIALREVADDFDGLLDLQIVALPSAPLVGAEGEPARRALADALTVGVDLVGGCPHLDTDGEGLIRMTLEAAAEAGISVDLHVDETLDPTMLTLRELARQVLDTGFDRPVTASHCVSLGMQTPEVQREVAGMVAEAGIGVVTLPQTNLYLQGRGRTASPPRGLTAIDALLEAGATVAAGGDNVQDPFNLVGRGDPLETAALLVVAGHRQPEAALEMVANRARSVLGLTPVELRPGDPADLVAVEAPSVRAAIAGSPSRTVFRGGHPVASTVHRTSVHREHRSA